MIAGSLCVMEVDVIRVVIRKNVANLLVASNTPRIR